jgi:hypothetical protein
MAYLDNTEIIVDAILTKKGRLKLAAGEELGIVKFALSDDEVDYNLYESDHPNGNYDSIIRGLPITEATSDETQVVRYKLLSLPKGSVSIPVVSLGINAITRFQYEGPFTITPQTSPQDANLTSGYTAILSDARAGVLVASANKASFITTPVALGDQIGATAIVATGTEFTFTPNPELRINIATTITVYGNDSGGSVSVPVTVTYKART